MESLDNKETTGPSVEVMDAPIEMSLEDLLASENIALSKDVEHDEIEMDNLLDSLLEGTDIEKSDIGKTELGENELSSLLENTGVVANTEYLLKNAEPTKLLETLGNMNDDELFEMVATIQYGSTAEVKHVLDSGIPVQQSTATPHYFTAEKMAGKTDPKYAQLKALLVQEKTAQATLPENVPPSVPPQPPIHNEVGGDDSSEGSGENIEADRAQRAGAVVYHREPGMPLADTGIMLMLNMQGQWQLPEGDMQSQNGSVDKQVEDMVRYQTGVDTQADKVLGSHVVETSADSTTNPEVDFLLAKAESRSMPKEYQDGSLAKWVTLKEISENPDLRIPKEHMELIGKAVDALKEKETERFNTYR
jgi:hypothetical protein